MDNQIIPKIDLVLDSLKHLLTVSFTKTTSRNYPVVLSLLRGAKIYEEIFLGKNIIHRVAFGKDRMDAARALSFIRYSFDWKGMQVYAGGKMIQNCYKVAQVLECYLGASGCDDWKAHCYTVINDPFFKERLNAGIPCNKLFSDDNDDWESEKEEFIVDQYIFPCKKLLTETRFKFIIGHPSSEENQIQAEAIDYGCDWCPYFNHNDYKKTGTTVKRKQWQI